ncbi:MAG: type II secretion system protein, partial [Pseudomonadota bacterium]
MLSSKSKQGGFTLIEVIVALTIAGLVLGAVLGLSAGSKRLAFRAQHNIEQTLAFRAALNLSQGPNRLNNVTRTRSQFSV